MDPNKFKAVSMPTYIPTNEVRIVCPDKVASLMVLSLLYFSNVCKKSLAVKGVGVCKMDRVKRL